MDTFSQARAQATCYARDDERLHTTLTSRTRQRLGLSLHMLLLALAPPAIWALDGCNPKATATDFQTAPISMCETSFDDESTVLASTCTAAAADDVCRMVRRGWWSAAKAYLPSVAEAERARIRKFMEAHRAGAASIVALLRQGKGSLGSTLDERTVVTPACQWAQNDSVVSLAVRFSPKKHGPVSVANVDEPSVDLNATHLTFGALARGKPLRFALEVRARAAAACPAHRPRPTTSQRTVPLLPPTRRCHIA